MIIMMRQERSSTGLDESKDKKGLKPRDRKGN